jgi:uncharacterized membrane protein YqjE
MTTPGPTSLRGSLRALGDNLLASAQDRIELFALELQEEKCRLVRTFVFVIAVVFLCMMAILFASLTAVYLFWDSARLGVLGGLTVVYAGAFVVAIIALRRHWARQPRPFSATQQELMEDRECIRNRN